MKNAVGKRSRFGLGAGRRLVVCVAAAAIASIGSSQTCSEPVPFPVLGDVEQYVVSPDENYVVYRADADVDDVFELYSVRMDGTTTPVKLNAPLLVDSDVRFDFAITSDSSTVVYPAPFAIKQNYGLFSVPIAGGAATRLDAAVAPSGLVGDFRLTMDSSRVVYEQKDSAQSPRDLFVAPLDGGAAPVRLTPVFSSSNGALEWDISPDSAWLAFTSTHLSTGVRRLFSGPLDGSTPAIGLNPTLPATSSVGADLRFSPDSSRVVFRRERKGAPLHVLLSVARDGGPATTLNGPLVNGGSVLDFDFMTDGQTVIYRADENVNGREDLYVVPFDRSSPSIRITDAPANGDVHTRYSVSPSLDWVVYLSGSTSNPQLNSTRLDGSLTTKRLSGVPVQGGGVHTEFFIGSGDRVVYRADEDIDQVFELFSAPIDGSTAAVKLHPDLPRKFAVSRQFQLSPDGRQALYVSAPSGRSEAFSVLIDGSGAPVSLSRNSRPYSNDFQTTSPGLALWKGVRDDIAPQNVTELFVAPLDGSTSETRLNGDLALGPGDGAIEQFDVSTQASRVAYRARETFGHGIYHVAVRDEPCATKVVPDEAIQRIASPVVLDENATTMAFIAYAPGATSEQRLYTMPFWGGPSTEVADLTNGAIQDDYQFSPDGMWLVFRAKNASGEHEVFAVASDGTAAPVRLNGDLIAGGDVATGFLLASTSDRVVYLADQDEDNRVELYSAPIDGSAAAVKLNAPGIGNVQPDVRLAPDGAHAIYRAAENEHTVYELYSVVIDGTSARTRLNGDLAKDGGVDSLDLALFSADSSELYYLSREAIGFQIELFHVAVDGSAPSTKLNAPLFNRDQVYALALFGDESRIAYAAGTNDDRSGDLFVASLDGSGTLTRLTQVQLKAFVSRPMPGANGDWIAFTGDLDIDGVNEIYRIRTDGRGAIEKINAPMATYMQIDDARLTPDRQHVLYYGDVVNGDERELFVAPIDGSLGAHRVNGPLVDDGDVLDSWIVTADSKWVVYAADQIRDGDTELFYARIDGNTPAMRLSHPLYPITADCSGATASTSGPLWPPNGRFVAIDVEGAVAPNGLPVELTILGVTQDEPVSDPGSGSFGPDAIIQNGQLYVRVERSAIGDGRVYHIHFSADDGVGTPCTGLVTVSVPISVGANREAIDSGVSYDSFQGPRRQQTKRTSRIPR